MIDRDAALTLLSPQSSPSETALQALHSVAFEDLPGALLRFQSLCQTEEERELCARMLPALLHTLTEAATPDGSLLNFQRYLQCVESREHLFRTLAEQPRSIEILVKLFVGSQFLTEILLRTPTYLDRLTEHKRLAEFKSRSDFVEQGRLELQQAGTLKQVMNELRRFQQWELLRLAACDTFGLMDLKTVTLQLALLADSLVQVSLEQVAALEGLPVDDFCVLAFGKLGGEELNYSSDIDLVFVCEQGAERYWNLGQKLIRTLADVSELGFLYRVDMRLRPWGNAGPLVTTADAYVDYLRKHGQLWEKQALLKARPIAGNLTVGQSLIERLRPFVFDIDPDAARRNVRQMKRKIEEHLERRGHRWGEVKGGPGGIRDIEFVTQLLQLIHGSNTPEIHSINTLDGLIRLVDAELILPEEYRRLTGGYLLLRTIEHSLQLMHNQQEHLLPKSPRGLAYLARRLDFPNSKTFVEQYELHTRSVREIFERYLDPRASTDSTTLQSPVDLHFGQAAASYHETFTPEDAHQHVLLLNELSADRSIRVQAKRLDAERQQVTIVGFDRLGDLSAICGLFFAYGYDIESGNVFTGADVETSAVKSASGPTEPSRRSSRSRKRKFVNVFRVRKTQPVTEEQDSTWLRFEQELQELVRLAGEVGFRESQGRLARRVASAIEGSRPAAITLLPVEIEIEDRPEEETTILNIRADDTPGFLYELTNAIAVSGWSINRMTVQSVGHQVIDTLHVAHSHGQRERSHARLNELRAAIVLIKHFTHLLPQSPNPEAALVHFQEFVENLFRQPNWLDQLGSLQDSEVLAALAKLLGISDFLWDDFLRLQHENLFPVVTNVEGLQQARDRKSLARELKGLLAAAVPAERRQVLNAFKDREMMRVDMRHILGLQDKFGMFARELTHVAEVVVEAACRICHEELAEVHGEPRTTSGASALSVCALGKFGGRELGYASDIELIFIYDGEGETTGPQVIPNLEFYQRLVELFQHSIHSKRKGIFEVDLRLRPFGKAGSRAVSFESFAKYFDPAGPAWPYERQALVKLRPISGDKGLGQKVIDTRDALIYRGTPFDVAAMRAMREKQNRQLVRAGTFNAKLSPGGLVDCEYLVQGLQITFGHLDPSIREPNTREAMKALEQHGLLTGDVRVRLRDAYRFFRRLIDALRMVRGDASDLAVPPQGSDEFLYLARRLNYDSKVDQLQVDLETHTRHVVELSKSLESLMKRTPRTRRPRDDSASERRLSH
ncbi:glutamine synthetase adenylyltransferase [Planctomicrobium sp. SH664]|uniref:[protein-PII] uridylyltransferase family protein n=1 Tax=Planctomicrobium sp. SH664 TaxID=3448125 RepID=UPI003F5C1B97